MHIVWLILKKIYSEIILSYLYNLRKSVFILKDQKLNFELIKIGRPCIWYLVLPLFFKSFF